MVQDKIEEEVAIATEMKEPVAGRNPMVKFNEKTKLFSVQGASEKEIAIAYTWEQFFQNEYAPEVSYERSLFFTLMRAGAAAESSQGKWIILRVQKAHWGRSPILFNWRNKLIGLNHDELKAQVFTHMTQPIVQQLRELHQNETKETKAFSFNPKFLMSTATTRQITKDGAAVVAVDYNSKKELYGPFYWVLSVTGPNLLGCLVFNTSGFEIPGIDSSLYNSWTPLLLFYKEGANWIVLLGCFEYAQRRSFIPVLKLVCLLRYAPKIQYFLVTKWEKAVPLSIEGEKICIFVLSEFLSMELMRRKARDLLLFAPLSTLYSSVEWVSHGDQDFIPVATAIMRGCITAMNFFDVELFHIGSIHWCYCLIKVVLASIHSTSIRTNRANQKVGVRCSDLSHEALYLLEVELEKGGPQCIDKKLTGILLVSEFIKAHIRALAFCISYIIYFEAVKWFKVLTVPSREGKNISTGTVPFASNPPLVWTDRGEWVMSVSAMGTGNCEFFALGFQTAIIDSGFIASYCDFIQDTLKILDKYLRHLTPLKYFVDDFLKSSCLLGYNCSIMVTHRLIEWDSQVRSKKRLMLSDFGWLMHFELTGGAQEFVIAAMKIIKRSLLLLRFLCVEWQHIGFIHYIWGVYHFANDDWASSKHPQNQSAPSRNFVVTLLLLYTLQVPRNTDAKMPLIATCSIYCWLVVCRFLMTIIAGMLPSVKSARFVIIIIPNMAQTWIKSSDANKQKLTLAFTYHLEDKVKLLGGSNDETQNPFWGCSYHKWPKAQNQGSAQYQGSKQKWAQQWLRGYLGLCVLERG